MDYSPFANTNDEYFDSLNETTTYEKARFQNAIFDEVHYFESIDIVCSPDKSEWGYDTVFLWKGNSVEAGNIELGGGVPVEHLIVRRRKKDDFVFEDIKVFDFDPQIQFYEFKDRFIESYEDYVYGIQPVSGSVLGELTTGEVESSFDSVWIVGKDTQYKLEFNLSVESYETNMPHSLVETMGSKFPKVIRNGEVKYRQGSLACTLVSDETLSRGVIEPKAEKKIRRSIMAFLTDNKPKFFKDGSGESMLISILGAPTLTPNNDLNQLVYEMEVGFVEVGETNVQSLINNGLFEEVN